MEQIGYQIVHAIAGRMRIKAVWLETDPEAAGKLQRLIESLSFTTSVRLNPLAQSIVLTYKASAVSIEEAQAQLISLIEQVNPIPPPVEPPVAETAPSEVPSTAPPTNSEPPTTSKSATTSDPTATSAIPSPWDDALEPADDRLDLRLHSTASLAKRLNTTSQAITQRRTKPNFDGWTQVQDPDGIAWDYDEASQSFSPASPSDPKTEPQKSEPNHSVEASGEVVGETLGESIGAVVGEAVGAVLLGPVGAVIGEELGAIAGEIVGAELGKEVVDGAGSPHAEIGGVVGSMVGEALQGEAGRSQGSEIGAEVGAAISSIYPQGVASSHLQGVEEGSAEGEVSEKTSPRKPRKSTKSSEKKPAAKKPRPQS